MPTAQYYQYPRVRTHAPRRGLTLNAYPRAPSFLRPPVQVPMRSANIAPPRRYHPPTTAIPVLREEPKVSVQTLSNGVQSVQPLRQVLGGSSSHRPVIVITRQIKMPSGEVYNQRFTQPIQPPEKFVNVVRRVTSEACGSASQQVAVVSTSITPRNLIQLPTPSPSSPNQQLLPPTTNAPTTTTTLAPPIPTRKIIRVIRSSAPNAIRILPPKSPS